MKRFFLLIFLVFFFNSYSQTETETDIKAIHKVLEKQKTAWSNNNIEDYMLGYWKSDSLKFYGSNGITYGWKNTLERYKKAYPTKDHTGKLDFKTIDISKISEDAYFVMGEFYLVRKTGNANGIFMIIFKKINGLWKIIADMSA